LIKQAVLAAALGLVLAVAARAQVDVPTTYGDAMRWYGEAAEAGDAEAQACAPAEGDAVAVIGENRRLLIFPLDEVPTRSRGRGVILQKYRQGGLADIKTFTLAEGLSWKSGERTRTETDLTSWIGKRAQAGRLPPKGFPRTNRFG